MAGFVRPVEVKLAWLEIKAPSPADAALAAQEQSGAESTLPPQKREMEGALIGPATLQDFWRADPATGRLRSVEEMIALGELVLKANAPHRPPGAAAPSPPFSAPVVGGEGAAAPTETYHIVHLPLTYEDGTPTGKESWPEDALASR